MSSPREVTQSKLSGRGSAAGRRSAKVVAAICRMPTLRQRVSEPEYEAHILLAGYIGPVHGRRHGQCRAACDVSVIRGGLDRLFCGADASDGDDHG